MKQRSFSKLKEKIAAIRNPQIQTTAKAYLALQAGYAKELEFVKRIGRYNSKWENPRWILGLPEG